MITEEQVHRSSELFTLADDTRAEAKLWKSPHLAQCLEAAARQLEAAARIALHADDATYGDAWVQAGRRYLDGHVTHRRFIEALGPLGKRTRRPILSLDCRDGVHHACPVCDCRCHDWSPKP